MRLGCTLHTGLHPAHLQLLQLVRHTALGSWQHCKTCSGLLTHGCSVTSCAGCAVLCCAGYHKDGHHRDGYNDDGLDIYGYDKEGFDKFGWDKYA